jgi:hypothetical protein
MIANLTMDGKSIEYGSNNFLRNPTWQTQCYSSNPTLVFLTIKLPQTKLPLFSPTKSHSNVLLPMHMLKYMAPTPKEVCQKEVIGKRVKEKKVKEKEDLHPPRVANTKRANN